MKQHFLTATLASLFPFTSLASTVSLPLPEMYGSIQAQASWHENADYTTDIAQAQFGVVGMVKADTTSVRYRLEAEYSESIAETEDDNDGMISEANLAVMNPLFGGAFIGTGTTGAWNDLYSKVDIFNSNNMERHSSNLLFGAKHYANNQLGLMTPFYGPFQFKAAVVSGDEYNGSDIDTLGFRAIYKQDIFSVVLNHSFTSKEMLNSAKEDGQRTIVATSYNLGNLYLAALAEFDYDMPFDARNVYGVSAKYSQHNTTYSLGYQYADWKGSRENEALYLANVRHDFNPNIAVFVEGALFDEDGKNHPKNTIVKGNNVNLGLIVSF
ncbi:porin [Enterovibrio paralichthyis]|uniref:porin n=1 Tax=Enterovibrio paralichthyis TaxID=2853805 RepID=UPI001C448C05|nr:porin [Enterovibrio paralichthyis]MBV7300207.1 porin [Enterovibrio paralichthyis]